ncbi:growth hormone secretagogue receptor type 1-like [Saccoglossus kowalevskii]|uniref:Growth hormone secretagogue receptor type 1-like n=1 Tax=Saccoglossus kowalevskii TaxID=10224 RepID=A0ABM0LY95_SACKO|nr:PREDICTED: growth hormone secretagogue receptor type 1-like [Saccoglossus kowalevskii]
MSTYITRYNFTAMEDASNVANMTSNYSDYDYIDGNDGALNDIYDEMRDAIRVPMTILWITILLVGLLGNVAFMYVAIKVRWMRTVTNLYLMNLSLADVAYLCGNLPIEVMSLYGVNLENQFAVCFLTTLLTYLCQYVGMFSITIISIERYYAICCPLTAKKLSSKSRSRNLIIIAWIVAALLSSVFFASCILENIPFTISIFLMVIQTVPFVASMVIVLLLYLIIGRQIANSTQREAVPCKGSRARKERRQVINLLIVTAIIFFLSVCPYQGFLIYYLCAAYRLVPAFQHYPSESVLRDMYIMNSFFITLMYFNSAINPVIYNATSSKYRQAFKEALPWLCWKGKPHHERMFSDRYNSEGNGTQSYNMRHSTVTTYRPHYPVSTMTLPTTV